MKPESWSRRIAMGAIALVISACQTTGVSPTGLAGGQAKCPEGPRQVLDCRGALQQYARDFKADLKFMSQADIGLGITSTKLAEADVLSGDLIQHYYQTCTLYNACLITQREYVSKMDRLQGIQLQVRAFLTGGAAAFAAQQNITINPPFGAQPPGGFPPPGAYPPPPPGYPPGGGIPPPPGLYPPPGGYAPAPGGVPPVSYPQQGAPYPPGDPGLQQAGAGYPPPPGQAYPGQQSPYPGQTPAGGQGPAPGLSVSIPPTQGPQDRIDTILNILREGSKLLREQSPQAPVPASPGPGTSFSPPAVSTASLPVLPPGSPTGTDAPIVAMVQPAVGPAVSPQEDLDSSLRAMLVSMKEEVARRDPARASGQVVVGNFTEEGQPWSSPLGALLQERVASLVESEGLFNPTSGVQTRGITVKQVAGVENPNDPKALGALYNSDLAIAGTYRAQPDRVIVRLAALDDKGGELAQATKEISRQAIPDVVAASPANAADTSQLLDSLNQLGAKSQGDARVEITTNRPGAGANFRLSEEIRYFVTSTMDGYLYLFHIDADKKILRIFPNQYQLEARVKAGAALEVPVPGAPFRFEASPPFGLETTFAIVTAVPLDEKDFQMVEGGFAAPKQDVPALVATRGISVKPVEPAAPPPAPAAAPPPPSPYPVAEPAPPTSPVSTPPLVWNSVTVLIRP